MEMLQPFFAGGTASDVRGHGSRLSGAAVKNSCEMAAGFWGGYRMLSTRAVCGSEEHFSRRGTSRDAEKCRSLLGGNGLLTV